MPRWRARRPPHCLVVQGQGSRPRAHVVPASSAPYRPGWNVWIAGSWTAEPYSPRMLKLGVNIDHVATLREARYRGRGRGEPDPVGAALDCEAAGAHGITAHLREDRRHIQDRDVWKLREVIKTCLLYTSDAADEED